MTDTTPEQGHGLSEAEQDALADACSGAGEYMCCFRGIHRKTKEPVGGAMLDAVERIVAARGADLQSRLACVEEATRWDRPYDERIAAIRGMCDLATNGMTPKPEDGTR